MWNAQCSYVSQLLSPKDFEGAIDSAMKEVLYVKWQGVLESHLWIVLVWTSFIWITSHPMVQPCDLSMAGQLKPCLSIPSAHKQQQHS